MPRRGRPGRDAASADRYPSQPSGGRQQRVGIAHDAFLAHADETRDELTAHAAHIARLWHALPRPEGV